MKFSGHYLRNYVIIFHAGLMLIAGCAMNRSVQADADSKKGAKVDPKIYDAYIGQYELAPNFILTISKKDNHLFAQATGQDRNEIFPESETEFFLKIVDAQITFVKDGKGKVTELILHQGGQDIPAKKISDKIPDERKAIEIDPKILDRYIGKYELAPNFILTVTKESDKLYAQATGQVKLEIFPESETKFFYKVVDAQITFVKDDDGAVNKLILHQNGEHHAKRSE